MIEAQSRSGDLPPPRLAAIDLGSNSFHLLVAEWEAGGYRPRVCLAQRVQLALGLRDEQLDPAAMSRALACLARFAPFLHGIGPGCMRAVGTQALRVARNRRDLLDPATALLGCPVEVISGEEEACLVYGVAADPLASEQLVVDVGGGSTELVAGRGMLRQRRLSVPVGCIGLLHHFPGGRLNRANFQRARAQASEVLGAAWAGDPIPPRVIGCSGTLLAIAAVLQRMGLGDGAIRRHELEQLLQVLERFPILSAVRLPGLSASRSPVFASGLALVCGLFDALDLDTMSLSRSGLREGVLAALAAGHEARLCLAAG